MTAATPDFPYGPRGIETGMVRQALPWAIVVVPVALVGGWLASGTDGVVSAALGCVLGAANLYASAWILERAARRGPETLMIASLGGFAVRLAVLTGIVYALSKLAFVDVAVLGVVLLCTYLALLILEAITVVRTDRALGLAPRYAGSPIDRSDDKESS